MKTISKFLSILFVLMLALPMTAQDKTIKRKVAIGRFSNETQYAKGLFYDKENDPMRKQALDILSSKLASSGKFILLEREDLDLLVKEAGTDMNKIGADYIILGSITEFGRKNEGEQKVLTPGVDGQLLCTATVYYVDGKEINRVVNSQVVTRQPVDEVVAIGTYIAQEDPIPMPEDIPQTQPAPTEPVKPDLPVIGNGIITTPEGEVLTYTQKLDCIATAYSCNGQPGITYSGTPARIGAIAVDPTVIPLGTRMYVVTNDGEYIYGICTAEDIGGSIKGNKVDLYFNTFDECWIFGIRDCTVYILE